MTSRQDKEQRAEARQVASDLREVRVGTEHDPEERPGVMGSVMRAVHSAKEAVVGKSRDEHGRRDEDVDYYAGDGGNRSREEMTESAAGAMDEKAWEAAGKAKGRAREAKERAKERTGVRTEKAKEAAGETKDYTAEKARETAEKTKETAESAADKTKEKAQEAKEKTNETAQSAVDKTKETTQSATSKLGELKDKAMGLFSGKKEDAKEQTAEEKLRESEEETRRRMEELRLKGRDEYKGDVARRVHEDKDESERRGGGILGALGSLKGKLTSHPTPSDPDNSRPVDKMRTREQKQVVMEDVSPGAVESTLKASDLASGQTFNDVGQIEDEGVIRVVRLDRRGKK